MPRNIISNIIKYLFGNKKDFKYSNNQIIAAITHDLKNPVIANIRAIELLLNGVFGNFEDNQKSILNDLLNSNHNILNMLINLLWLYKFDNTKIAVNLTTFCLNETLDEIFNDNKLILNSRFQSFKKYLINENTYIYADKMHIKRVISNILMNAVIHGREHSEVYIELYKEADKLIFLVKNQGTYIPKEELNSIFQKDKVFNQTSDCLSTGLGLYLSNSLLKLNGGEFIYQSSPDGLNTFGFSIPFNEEVLHQKKTNHTLTAG